MPSGGAAAANIFGWLPMASSGIFRPYKKLEIMNTKPWRPKAGLLVLTLELYETLAPSLRQDREQWVRRTLMPALQPAMDAEFVGAVCRSEEIAATIRQYEGAGVDALVVVMASYSPSQVALRALRDTRLPIVIWNTQELYAVDSRFSLADLFANHGVHGTQDLANVLLRSGVPFHYVTSHLRDPKAVDELADFVLAAAAVRRLSKARIGLMGYPFPGMGDFAIDTTAMTAALGCAWVNLPVEDYIRRSLNAETAKVTQLIAEYHQTYDVAGELIARDLETTARAELAVRGMVAEYHLDALTYQFMAFGEDDRTPTLPFVAASRLMAEGIGFGGEGDIIAAAGTTLLNWLNPPASFAEIFTIDFAGNCLFMSHMGEANTAMARRGLKIPLVARAAPITRTRERQLALVTTFEPGPATLMALTIGPAQRWRVIAAPLEILAFGPLTPLCVPHFKLRTPVDVRRFLTAYGQAGGPHHNAVCFGDARRRLRFAAGFLGADYFEL